MQLPMRSSSSRPVSGSKIVATIGTSRRGGARAAPRAAARRRRSRRPARRPRRPRARRAAPRATGRRSGRRRRPRPAAPPRSPRPGRRRPGAGCASAAWAATLRHALAAAHQGRTTVIPAGEPSRHRDERAAAPRRARSATSRAGRGAGARPRRARASRGRRGRPCRASRGARARAPMTRSIGTRGGSGSRPTWTWRPRLRSPAIDAAHAASLPIASSETWAPPPVSSRTSVPAGTASSAPSVARAAQRRLGRRRRRSPARPAAAAIITADSPTPPHPCTATHSPARTRPTCRTAR